MGCLALMAAVTNTWSPQTTGELQPRPGISSFHADVLRLTPLVGQQRIFGRDAGLLTSELGPMLSRTDSFAGQAQQAQDRKQMLHVRDQSALKCRRIPAANESQLASASCFA